MKLIRQGLHILLITALSFQPLAVAMAEDSNKTFSQEQLDQMMAPIALYPDSLLSQILMASTYPADVSEAVKWSKANTQQKGDDAVKAVQDKSWDPSVMSLVAFPQVLEMMGQKPDWVQNVGDAFLADSKGVMDTVQALRKKAKDQGNLETTKEQKVTVEEQAGQQVIVVEPANPTVVYVPTYNPTVVYGTWWYPAYPPYYYHPIGTAFATGIAFGIGIGITNALWGGCNWGRGNVNINVNRHNNINVNRNHLNVNNRNTNWNHNSNNRKGVPYRDQASRQKYSKQRSGIDQRRDYRGRDAQRDKARSTLSQRGFDPAKGRQDLMGAGGSKARDSVNRVNRDFSAGKHSNLGGNRNFSSSGFQRHSGDHALNNVGKSNLSRSNFNRGQHSFKSSKNFGGSRGGGGSHRFGGGGGGGFSRGGGGFRRR